MDLPTPLAKFPTQIGQATSGVSGDGNTIVILAAAENDPAAASQSSILIHYAVPTQTAFAEEFQQSPPAGPRSVAVDQNAINVLTDWGLQHYLPDSESYLLAEFPRPNGAFNIGSHAWDLTRNLIYAQVPTPDDTSVLHVMATDNLTVQERLQMAEDLSGKSQMSSDGQVMISASVSGVTILPIGQLPNTAQVGASQEAVLFAADSCNQLTLSQTNNIVSLGTVPADFTLSLPGWYQRRHALGDHRHHSSPDRRDNRPGGVPKRQGHHHHPADHQFERRGESASGGEPADQYPRLQSSADRS